MKYQVIYADPPWKFKVWCYETGSGRSPDQYYPTMELGDICSLGDVIKMISAKDCILFLWATFPKLEEALEVIKAWGFIYKSVAFVWVKLNKSSLGIFTGLGYWTRGNVEICLLATKGHPKRIDKSIRQLIISPRREHSRKPDEVRDRIVQLMGDLPRIELFAREQVEGWDAIGYDIDGLDIKQSLEWIMLKEVQNV